MLNVKTWAIIIAMIMAIPASAQANTLVVSEVLGGDLIRFGDSFVARLAGLSAPPLDEVLGREVYDFTKRELEGRLVKVFTWTTNNRKTGIVYDDLGRAFVQIFYGQGYALGFNELLLKKGYARVDNAHLPEDLKHYFELENEARRKGLGLWKTPEAANKGGSEAVVPPALEKVLEAYLQALGGEAALSAIRTRRLTGSLIHKYPEQDPPEIILPAEVLSDVPDRWLLTLKTRKGLQRMGSDGRRGWTQDADRILLDDRQLRSRLAFLFDPQGALRLEDYFPRLELAEKSELGNRPVQVVASTADGGQRRLLYFDAESGLLIRIGDDIEIQEHLKRDGVHHPSRIAISRRGGVSTYVFDEVETGRPLEAGSFAVPDMGRAFPDAFQGLEDSSVLPLLKDFPSTHEEMSIPCRDGRFLHDLILRSGYRRGLEIGTFTGYSALWLGHAFQKTGGALVTIEIDPVCADKARENIRAAGLDRTVSLRVADALAEIPRLEGGFDLVFIDAWKPDYLAYLKLIRDRVLPGGAIIAHNVTNYERDMQDFLAAVRNDPEFETTLEEISAEGMSISLKRRTR